MPVPLPVPVPMPSGRAGPTPPPANQKVALRNAPLPQGALRSRRTVDINDLGGAQAALGQLAIELRRASAALQAAAGRAEALSSRRSAGQSWTGVMSQEPAPLLTESVLGTIDAVTLAAGRWRRANVRALHAEGLTMDRISELYGVSRQRVSALLQSGPPAPSGAGHHSAGRSGG
ncbi:MAG: hypothetical protein NVSMB55_13120 [Mycobacteriales bacterium]